MRNLKIIVLNQIIGRNLFEARQRKLETQENRHPRSQSEEKFDHLEQKRDRAARECYAGQGRKNSTAAKRDE